LLILIIGAWLYSVPYQKMRQGDNPNFLTDINIEKIAKIKATSAEGTTATLYKKSNIWVTDPSNWPTETIIIDALIDKLKKTTEANFTVASVNNDKKDSFQVGDKGLAVKLYNAEDEEEANFTIGRISNDYRSTYISRSGDAQTYEVTETFVRAFDMDSWQDKTIFEFEVENIEHVILTYPNEVIKMTHVPDSRGEVFWRTTEPYEVRLNKDKVFILTKALANLEAVNVPEQDREVAGLNTPTLTIHFYGLGIDETLVIGKKNTGTKEYFVLKQKTDQIFLMLDDKYKEIVKRIKDLR